MDGLTARRGDIGLVFLFTIATKIVLAALGLTTPDGCLYLDAGRHFFQGQGFVSSYNFYQYWGPGTTYPAWPFMPPLYPLLAGFIFFLFHSLAAVNGANVVLSGVNTVLLYLIVRRLFDNRSIALASALLASLAPPMRLAPLPWNEQLDLFFLLASVLYYLGAARRGPLFLATLGALTALGILTRVAHLASAPVFLIVFALEGGPVRAWFLKACWFLAGVAALLVPYEAFCYIRFGVFFPEYVQAVKNANATLYGGSYGPTKPVLRTAFPGDFFTALGLLAATTPGKIVLFLGRLQDFLGAVAWLVPVRIVRRRIWRSPGESLLLLLGLVTMLFIAGSFYWEEEVEFDRYSLIFIVLLLPLAIGELHDLLMRVPGIAAGRLLKVYFAAAIAALMIVPLHRVVVRNVEFFEDRKIRGLDEAAHQQMLRWLQDHTGRGDLIATSEIGTAFGIDRPIVGLPAGVMFNKAALGDYVAVYRPKLVWVPAGFPTEMLEPFFRRIKTGSILLDARYRIFVPR